MQELFYNIQNNNANNDSLLPQGIQLLAKHADMEILVQQKDYLEEVVKSVEHRGMNIQFDFNPMSGL